MTADRPESMSAEHLAKWLGRIFIATRGETRSSKQATLAQGEAVRTLVEEKVREAVYQTLLLTEFTDINHRTSEGAALLTGRVASRILGAAHDR